MDIFENLKEINKISHNMGDELSIMEMYHIKPFLNFDQEPNFDSLISIKEKALSVVTQGHQIIKLVNKIENTMRNSMEDFDERVIEKNETEIKENT